MTVASKSARYIFDLVRVLEVTCEERILLFNTEMEKKIIKEAQMFCISENTYSQEIGPEAHTSS